MCHLSCVSFGAIEGSWRFRKFLVKKFTTREHFNHHAIFASIDGDGVLVHAKFVLRVYTAFLFGLLRV